MIDRDKFEDCVRRSCLAPTIHNTQPARWVRDGDVLSLFCDTNIGLPAADADGRGAGLSCGAVLEGMALALSAHGIAAQATLTGHATTPGQGLVAVAHLTLSEGPEGGSEGGLHRQLEHRFTWRGAFAPEPLQLFGWTRPDTRLVMDRDSRAWLAERNDWASGQIMQDGAFRRELVNWMRLRDSHPRAGLDGMDRTALGLTKAQARAVPRIFLRHWAVMSKLGLTKRITQEVAVTLTAPTIALFHRDIHENSVIAGRAYLRLLLEAANLGLAAWPMAALADHPETRTELSQAFGIPSDRRLVQVLRLGLPTGAAPLRARRPLAEVMR